MSSVDCTLYLDINVWYSAWVFNFAWRYQSIVYFAFLLHIVVLNKNSKTNTKRIRFAEKPSTLCSDVHLCTALSRWHSTFFWEICFRGKFFCFPDIFLFSLDFVFVRSIFVSREIKKLLWTCAVDRSRAERMMKTVGCWFRRVYSLRYMLHTSVLQDSYSVLNRVAWTGEWPTKGRQVHHVVMWYHHAICMWLA